MNIDTERVIIEVQYRPVLWDMANERYKDRDARQEAWLEVCRQLIENFETLSDAEKKDNVKKIQARWKTARDCYTKTKASSKNLKSGSSAKKGKVYSYYNMMTFLETNSSNESQESIGSIEDDVNRTESVLPGSCSGQDSATPSTSKRTRTSTSPTPFEKELLNCVKQRRVEENYEDMSFFMSIMPTIKKFNTYQKLIFIRTKVMEYLIDVERQKLISIDDLSFINTQNYDETENIERN